ncbi:MAG: type 4a pilus biogenesis protein PilO [Desulfobacterales bacterium]|jgi:Tfp pilus assembly protein PilO
MEFERFVAAARKSRVLWGFCLVLLALNAGYYVFFIRDQQQQVRDLQVRYSRQRAELAQFSKTAGGSELYAKRVAVLEAFQGHLPQKVAFTEKAAEIDELLQNNGLRVEKMSFAPSEAKELGLWKYATSLAVKGSYASLKNFLADLQNSPSLFAIEKLSFENEPENNGSLELTLNISTFFR